MTVSIFDLPKIDGHCHVLDPQRFPYPAKVPYHPQGQEVGTAAYFSHVMAAYGVQHALRVARVQARGNRCIAGFVVRLASSRQVVEEYHGVGALDLLPAAGDTDSLDLVLRRSDVA